MRSTRFHVSSRVGGFSTEGRHSRQANAVLDDVEDLSVRHILGAQQPEIRRLGVHPLAEHRLPTPVVSMADGTMIGKVRSSYATCRVLEGAGFQTIEASSGTEALQMLFSPRLETVMPDIVAIILDVKLPDMNGYDVCRAIRNYPETAALPILQVSASFADPSLRANALSGGADAYVAQPVHPAELIALVEALIRAWEAVQGEVRQVFCLMRSKQCQNVDTSPRIISKRDEVVLRGIDNGCGISPETIQHIFEPFFTTREGTGTGLGLWVSTNIATKHGGSIHATSNQQQSERTTTFELILPRTSIAILPGSKGLQQSGSKLDSDAAGLIHSLKGWRDNAIWQLSGIAGERAQQWPTLSPTSG